MSKRYMKKNKPIRIIYGIIQKCIDKSAGSNRAELQSWSEAPETIEKFHKNIKKEQEVCTLLFPETPKKISSFFYPIKLMSIENNKILNLDDFRNTSIPHLLINGSLGQGKSMLLRYLQFLELNNGKSLPIIVELRKVKNASDIIESARVKLESLGLKCSSKLFDNLLTNSWISLMYDGFDEIPLEHRNDFNDSLKNLCNRYPNTKVIVTSREGTEISINPTFKSFNICRLTTNDIAPFIKEIIPDSSIHSPILAKIKESKDFDYEVLDTPLLVTWFIIVYNKRLKIPKTKLGFYEDLFVAILTRHDGMKESHNRATKSKLSDDDIKKVFCTLCFLARESESKALSRSKILEIIRRSLNICGFQDVKNGDYLHDLIQVTCLVRSDGVDYNFIHESIAQYFSACFVKDAIENNAARFYENRVNDWKQREGELSFLKDIDEIRYLKYFYIPSINHFMKQDKESIADKIFDQSIAGYFTFNQNIRLLTVALKNSEYFVFRDLSESDYQIKRIAVETISEIYSALEYKAQSQIKATILNSSIRISDFRYIETYDLLRKMKKIDHFNEIIGSSIINRIKEKKNKATERIELEVKKEDLFA